METDIFEDKSVVSIWNPIGWESLVNYESTQKRINEAPDGESVSSWINSWVPLGSDLWQWVWHESLWSSIENHGYYKANNVQDLDGLLILCVNGLDKWEGFRDEIHFNII